MPNRRPSYLLTHSHSFELENTGDFYDDAAQLNLVNSSGQNIPLVAMKDFGWTHSKTMQAPGDDDPDPAGEECY